MGLTGKTVVFAVGLGVGIVMTAAIVKAASPGEDFSWLSVSQGGLRIGDPGSEGEDTAPENVIEFQDSQAAPGTIVFNQGGGVLGNGELNVLSAGSTVVGACALVAPEEGEGGALEIRSGVALGASPVIEGTNVTAGLVSVAGDVAICAGTLQSEEGEGEDTFYPQASVYCSQNGDVTIQLGIPPSSSKSMKAAKSAAAFAEEPAPLVSGGEVVATPTEAGGSRLGFQGNMPRFRMPQRAPNLSAESVQ